MYLLLAATLALSAPVEKTLTWNISVEGQLLGTRTLTIRYPSGTEGQRRVLESWTELDGRVGPLPLRYRERLTANIEYDPASFLSVQETNRATREVSARRVPSGWMVSLTEDGRYRSFDIPAGDVNLSTVDLLDPESAVPLSRFSHANVLSAETGTLFEGDVLPLDPVTLKIGEQALWAQPYRFTHQEGTGTFFYTAEGFLLRYEMRVLGYDMVAVLAAPPPGGPDDVGLTVSATVGESDL